MALRDPVVVERNRVLLARMRRDDTSALRELMEVYYARLVNFAVEYAGSKDAAEDAVQAVFIRLWERRMELLEADGFVGYLYGAVHKRAVSVFRAQATAVRYHERAVADDVEARPYSVNAGAAQVELDELTQQLRREIEALPPRCREVFRMSRVQGLTYREIAEILGVTVSTVRMQMIKALRVLREDLAGWGE